MNNASKPTLDGLKLFRVELTQTIYVLARSQIEALSDAPMHARDDMGEPDCDATEVRSAHYISEGTLCSLPHWDRYCQDPPTVAECIEIIAARSAT